MEPTASRTHILVVGEQLDAVRALIEEEGHAVRACGLPAARPRLPWEPLLVAILDFPKDGVLIQANFFPFKDAAGSAPGRKDFDS